MGEHDGSPSGQVSGLADDASLVSAQGAELAFASDLTVVACSKAYGAISGCPPTRSSVYRFAKHSKRAGSLIA